MVLRLQKKKTPPKIGKQLQDYIDKNPGRMTSRLLKLARATKPTGRLNIDDLMNAKDSGILAGTGFRKKTQSKGPAGKVIGKKINSLKGTKSYASQLARAMPKKKKK